MSNAISRRHVTRGLGSLVTNPSVQPTNYDETLLRACNEFQFLADSMDQLLTLDRGIDEDDKVLWQILHGMDRVEPLILNTPALTGAGMRAKAKIVSWSRAGRLGDDPDACLDERMVASILRDLLRRS